MKNEIWKPIKGYEGLYEISTLGRIKNLGKHYKICLYGHEKTMYSEPRMTKLKPDKHGYPRASLTKDGVCKSYFVHRLVAQTFIPNDNPLRTQVNHINGVQCDNRVENLEWCTPQENTLHAHRTGLCGRGKKAKYVAQLNDEYEIVHVYRTATLASIAMGLDPRNSNIALACRKKCGKHYGYIWSYISLEQYAQCLIEFMNGSEVVVLDGIEHQITNNPYSHVTGNGYPVAQLQEDGSIINVYRNARQASLALHENDNGRTIRRVCIGDLEHHKGYRWKWISDKEYNFYISEKG